MARNRKRRSDRRPQRPADGGQSRRGVATARPQRSGPERDEAPAAPPHAERPEAERRAHEHEQEETPSPIEHATPDVELAEAQLAQGRPAGQPPLDADEIVEEPADSDLEIEEELEAEEEREDSGGRRGRPRSRAGAESGGELTPAAGAHAMPGNRLVHFVQGSWRELQRVQWPDRRQVIQATGVVIGFVIVAGAFLGAADWAATKIVHFILQ